MAATPAAAVAVAKTPGGRQPATGRDADRQGPGPPPARERVRPQGRKTRGAGARPSNSRECLAPGDDRREKRHGRLACRHRRCRARFHRFSGSGFKSLRLKSLRLKRQDCRRAAPLRKTIVPDHWSTHPYHAWPHRTPGSGHVWFKRYPHRGGLSPRTPPRGGAWNSAPGPIPECGASGGWPRKAGCQRCQ